jgi:hypothetical protein
MKYPEGYGGDFGTERFDVPNFLAPQRARDVLSQHPHFYGRVDQFQFEWKDETLVVKGTVPTYYLKQLLQNALKNLDDVRIDDRVNVVWSDRDSAWPQR